jgi:hypothetical protein
MLLITIDQKNVSRPKNVSVLFAIVTYYLIAMEQLFPWLRRNCLVSEAAPLAGVALRSKDPLLVGYLRTGYLRFASKGL